MRSLSYAMTAHASSGSTRANLEKCTRRRPRFSPWLTLPRAQVIGNSNYVDAVEPFLSGARKPEKLCANSPGTVKSFSSRNSPMNLRLRSLSIFAIAFVLASCAEPQKTRPVMKAAASGTSFNQVGTVTFYQGQPCTSQIMFVFGDGRSASIPLAASMRETKVLTDAAHRNRRVRVSGKWRHSKQPGCAYVEVTRVEMQKLFW